MIRREVFEEVGLFREDFPVCEDYEMWLRICARWDVGYVPEPLIKKYGGHEDQLSRRFVAMDYWRVLALEPYLTSPLISTRERNLVRETIEQKSEILLRGYRKHDNFEHFHVVEALHERVKKSPDFLLNHE